MAKLNLLKLIKVICESCGARNGVIVQSGLHHTVEMLSRQDDAVLVRQVSQIVAETMINVNPPLSSACTRDGALVGGAIAQRARCVDEQGKGRTSSYSSAPRCTSSSQQAPPGSNRVSWTRFVD